MVKFTDDTAPSGGPATGDLIPLVDVSDTTDDAAGSSKTDTIANIIAAAPLTQLSDVDTDKSKTPADGDVLTYDGTDWNAETPAAGGGGNPYGADLVLAPTGGDYDNLADLAANATSGQVIYVEPGTYTAAGVTFSQTDLTIIGHDNENCIFHVNSTTNLLMSGAFMQLKNLKIQSATSSGDFVFQSSSGTIQNCTFYSTASQINAFQFPSNYLTITNCNFEHTGSGAGVRTYDFGCGESLISNNHFNLSRGSNSLTDAMLQITGNGTTFTGNALYTSSGSNNGSMIEVRGGDCKITNNHFVGIVPTAGRAIYMDGGDRNLVANNSIRQQNEGIVTSTSAQNNIFESNIIRAYTTGIQLAMTGSSIIGGFIRGDSGAGDGILINSGVDETHISGVRITGFADGVHITDSTNDKTAVVGCALTGNTNAINDNGTGTITSANIT